MTKDRTGKIILRFLAVSTIVGGVLADWNRTHLFNPNWTPHAKFHDAMTICLGVFLGATSLVLLGRRNEVSLQNLRLAAILPAFFYLSMALSFLFPNTGGIDAEFPELVPRIGNIYLNELPFALMFLLLTGIGYALVRMGDGARDK